MKPPVLGRKNYLFCGSDAGGQRAACFYTIIETAKLNGINPEAYLVVREELKICCVAMAFRFRRWISFARNQSFVTGFLAN
jgi:hypothetical protein